MQALLNRAAEALQKMTWTSDTNIPAQIRKAYAGRLVVELTTDWYCTVAVWDDLETGEPRYIGSVVHRVDGVVLVLPLRLAELAVQLAEAQLGKPK